MSSCKIGVIQWMENVFRRLPLEISGSSPLTSEIPLPALHVPNHRAIQMPSGGRQTCPLSLMQQVRCEQHREEPLWKLQPPAATSQTQHTLHRRAGKPATQQVEPEFGIFVPEWQICQSHSGKLLIQCKLTLIIRICWWGKCFCRLCTGTGTAYACSFKIKSDHLVSCFLLSAMRQDVPLIATMRNVPPCATHVYAAHIYVNVFSSHLHNCGHWCCTDMVLKGCRCTTLNTAVLSSISTNSILENWNLSDGQAAFIFPWYSSMKLFVMVGNPCLGFAEAFWCCIGGRSLHRWVLNSSSIGINLFIPT